MHWRGSIRRGSTQTSNRSGKPCRILRTAGPVLVLCLLAAGFAAGADRTGSAVTLPVTEVTIFKDGHAFVLHQGQLAVDADGDVVTNTVPAPVLGTLWAYTTAARGHLAGVAVAEQPVQRSRPVTSLRQLLQANIGAEAVLRFDLTSDETADQRRGRILAVPTTTGGNGQAGDLVLLQCGGNVRAFALSRIAEVVLPTEHQAALAVSEPERRLRFELDWQGQPPEQATVGMVYLQQGLRWIPSYRVSLDGAGTAVVELQATLVNELVDLDRTVVHLVAGVPSFRFAEALDPISLREAAEQLGEPFQRRSQTAQVFANVVMSQAVAPIAQEQAVPATAALPGSGGVEDLFVFSLDPLSLEKGQRMIVPISEQRLQYRDVYTLELAPLPPAELRQQYGRGQEEQLASLLEAPTVQHAIRLANSGSQPLTTAPALILENGQLLGQGMTTYTPVGSSSDLAITSAVGIPVLRSELEVAREHDAVRWEGSSYARVALEGTITLRNRTTNVVEVEVTRQVLGTAESASHDGVVSRSNVLEGSSLAPLRPAWWGWYSWPSWWHHFNGIGTIRWTVAIAPGQSVELQYTWSYYWR